MRLHLTEAGKTAIVVGSTSSAVSFLVGLSTAWLYSREWPLIAAFFGAIALVLIVLALLAVICLVASYAAIQLWSAIQEWRERRASAPATKPKKPAKKAPAKKTKKSSAKKKTE